MDLNMNRDETFTKLIVNNNYLVRDHRILDTRTVPGSTHIEILQRLIKKNITQSDLRFRKVVFKNPAITSTEFDCELTYHLHFNGQCWLVSGTAKRIYHENDLQEKNVHITDIIECEIHLVENTGTPAQINIARMMSAATYQVDIAKLYEMMRSVSVLHLDFFKVNGQIYCNDDEQLMEVTLGDLAEKYRPHFFIHPSFLDIATMAGLAEFPGSGMSKQDIQYTASIPFCINNVRIYKSSQGRKAYILSKKDNSITPENYNDSDISSIDVACYDENGELVFEYEKLCRKKIRQGKTFDTSLVSTPVEEPKQAITTSKTHEVNAGIVNNGVIGIHGFLKDRISQLVQKPISDYDFSTGFYDLGLDSSQLLVLVKELETRLGVELYPTLLFEFSTIEVLATHLQEEYGHIQINPQSQDSHYLSEETILSGTILEPVFLKHIFQARQVAQQANDTGANSRHVLFLASHSNDVLVQRCETQELDYSLMTLDNDGYEHVLASAKILFQNLKSIIQRKDKKPKIIQLVSLDEKANHFAAAAVAMLRSACQEMNCRGLWISFARLEKSGVISLLDILDKEANSSLQAFSVVKYDENFSRFEQEFTIIADKEKAAETFYKQNGVYVISGGAGGLGIALAGYILKNSHSKVYLLGRTELNDAIQQRLDETGKNSALTYLTCDITDLDNLSECLQKIRTSEGVINGIFHCAGVLKDQFIINKVAADFDDVLAPKILGTFNLDVASRQDKLDFFISFSSLAATTGNIAQTDYAFANAYMDNYIQHRATADAPGLSLSINWPAWDTAAGMQTQDHSRERLFDALGIVPLPLATGIPLIENIIASRTHNLVVLFGDKEKIQRTFLSNGAITNQPAEYHSPQQHTRSEKQIAENVVEFPKPPKHVIHDAQDIAVIGLAGRYPGANNIDEFYQNLLDSRNNISSFPEDRWPNYDFGFNVKDVYDHGGFIKGIELFDADFFNISTEQAMGLDPQTRHFIEVCFTACQDAGFTPATLENKKDLTSSVGVFAGVFWTHYELFASANTLHGSTMGIGNSAGSIANMTSYCLGLHGPSMAIDSMCSSALTSIHIACESLRSKNCLYALAGGVSLVTHPHKYLFLKSAGFLSTDGSCRSFGEGGDGFVTGEGAGAALLTTLENARKENYSIYGVIKGSAVNHNGRTSGFLVPDLNSQSEVMRKAIENSGIDSRHISYVEGHGTGTFLGDAIEVSALQKAFNKTTANKQNQPAGQYCRLGSVKSNIGHSESASGIAALTKVLLQFKHKTLLPSLNSSALNPNIPFEKTPFQVQRIVEPWNQPQIFQDGKTKNIPRIASISSFGAGGTNAHMVVQEYSDSGASYYPDYEESALPLLFIFSGTTDDQIDQLLRSVAVYLENNKEDISRSTLVDIAYTFQAGRDHYPIRRAFIANSTQTLIEKISLYLYSARDIFSCYIGNTLEDSSALKPYFQDNDFKLLIQQWIEKRKYDNLGDLWVKGMPLDWKLFYGDIHPKKLHLPYLQLAPQPYWLPDNRTTALANVTPADIEKAITISSASSPREIEESNTFTCSVTVREQVASTLKKNLREAQFFYQHLATYSIDKFQSDTEKATYEALLSSLHWHNEKQLSEFSAFQLNGRKEQNIWTIELSGLDSDILFLKAVFSLEKRPTQPVPVIDLQAAQTLAAGEKPQVQSPPRNDLEIDVAKIWSEVLDIPYTQLNRDVAFFKSGGDSLTMTRVLGVVAARFNVDISPVDFYDNSSIASLAHLITENKTMEVKQDFSAEGQQELAPLQRQLLQLHDDLISSAHYHTISTSTHIDASDIGTLVEHTIKCHDVLRLDLDTHQGHYIPLGEFEFSQSFDILKLDNLTEDNNTAALTDLIFEQQKAIELRAYKNFKIIYVASHQYAAVIVLAHHLLIDRVSFDLLCQDIATSLTAIANHEKAPALQKPQSFLLHVNTLTSYFSSQENFLSEKSYWLAQLTTECPRITKAKSRKAAGSKFSYDGNFLTQSFVLDKKQTKYLLDDCGVEFELDVDDFLVASLLMALHNIYKQTRLGLNKVNFGRTRSAKPVDFSRTLGFFQYEYPLCIDIPEKLLQGNTEDITNNCMAELRRLKFTVPGQGKSYGILTQVIKDQDLNKAASLNTPEISLGYIGEYAQLDLEKDSLFMSIDNRFPIHLYAAVVDGSLSVRLHTNNNSFSQKEAKALKTQIQQALTNNVKNHSGYLKYTLPNKQWLYKGEFKHHWNLSMMFKIKNVVPAYLKQAIYDLLESNKGLRHTFHLGEDNYIREKILRTDDVEILERIDLSDVPDEALKQEIETIADQRQTQLDLSKRAFRFILFEPQGHREARFQYIVHHALVDGYSVQLFLIELFTRYLSLVSGQPTPLYPTSDSMSSWSKNIYEYSNNPINVAREVNYWRSMPWDKIGLMLDSLEHLENNRSDVFGKFGKQLIIERTLDPEQSSYLQSNPFAKMAISTGDIIIAAFIRVLSTYTRCIDVYFDATMSGRESFTRGNVANTIGWFADHRKVFIKVNPQLDAEDQINDFKRQMRAQPALGMGFSSIKHLTEDPAIRKEFSEFPLAEACINYVSPDLFVNKSSTQVDMGLMMQHIAIAEESVGRTVNHIHSTREASYVHVDIHENCLRIQWKTRDNIYKREKLEAATETWINEVSNITHELKQRIAIPSEINETEGLAV